MVEADVARDAAVFIGALLYSESRYILLNYELVAIFIKIFIKSRARRKTFSRAAASRNASKVWLSKEVARRQGGSLIRSTILSYYNVNKRARVSLTLRLICGYLFKVFTAIFDMHL